MCLACRRWSGGNCFWTVCAVNHLLDVQDLPESTQEAGLDWQKLARNVVMDGAGGAINATRKCFSEATAHRDLEQVK